MLCIMYYTVCYHSGIFYAVVRQISMLFIDNNKISVFCILTDREGREGEREADRQTVRQTDREDRQRQTDRDRKTVRQTYRQTDRQTDKVAFHTHKTKCFIGIFALLYFT